MVHDFSANQSVVFHLYESIINTGKLSELSKYIDASYLGPNGERGPEGFASMVTSVRRGFPDVRFTVEDLFGERDKVVVRWSWQGTHQGPFRGIPPTGVRVTNTGIAIYQLRDGKVIQSWLETDRLGVLRALGALPEELTSRLQAAPPEAPAFSQ